jgi:hypothetical protein
MKKKRSCHGLHLITPEEAASIRQQAAAAAEAAPLLAHEQERSPASDQKLDPLIATGVRRYQQLQQEFDRELFRLKDGDRFDTQEIDHIAALLSELQLLAQRLARYGVQVRV